MIVAGRDIGHEMKGFMNDVPFIDVQHIPPSIAVVARKAVSGSDSSRNPKA